MAIDTGSPFSVLANPQPAGVPRVQLMGHGEPTDTEVENFGFKGLNRDVRVKILPEGFPRDALPRSSSSLFAIANRRGLFAAAGPTSFVIGTTASLREAFAKGGEYTPQLAIPLPIGVSHIAFNADESHLILGASSGGVAVYSIDALSRNGDAEAIFEVGTDGAELRELKPNPKVPELVAILTMTGDVWMLDLNTRSYKPNAEGKAALKSGVGTMAWSKQGKQIMCGMGDGTGWQMTPDGKMTATLPAPPGTGNHYISSIVWLENNVFITTHSPVPTDESDTESLFHLLLRAKDQFIFTKLFEPAQPFGMERPPPYYYTVQLRQYAPALPYAIIYSGTCSTDIGVLAMFADDSKEILANSFITAQFPDDTRRAQMPLSSDETDTSPIGMALDLSAKENVKRPVGGEEIDESPGPLPILMVLNYEGILTAWNIIYNDAIERGEKYSGMMIYDTGQPQSPVTPQQAPSQQRSQAATPTLSYPSFGVNPVASPSVGAPQTGGGAFGRSSFASTSATNSNSVFSQPAVSGSNSAAPALLPAFRQPPSPVANTAAPSFGHPSFEHPSFGQSSFGTSAVPPLRKPAFGQTGFGASPTGAPAAGGAFGTSSNDSAFTSFANKGGFAAVASASSAQQGPNIFGSGRPIATASTESAFGEASTTTPTFGSGGLGAFKLGSSFKADPSRADDDKLNNGGGSLGSLGMGFGDALAGSGPAKPALAAMTAPISMLDAPSSFVTTPPTTSGDKPASPFAGFGSTMPHPSAPNPFAQEPAASPSAGPPKSVLSLSSPLRQPESPKPEVLESPPEAPLPLQLAGDEKRADDTVPPAPLPPDPTTTATPPRSVHELPSCPGSSPATEEGSPLPPHLITPKKESPESPPAPLEDSDEEELSEEDQADGNEEEGDEEEEDEEEEDEEEEDEEGKDEDDKENKPEPTTGTPKSSCMSTPQPKPITTPKSGSSVFGGGASFSSTFGGADGVDKSSLFSNLISKKNEDDDEDSDEDEDESSPPPRQARERQGVRHKGSLLSKAKTPPKKSSPTAHGGLKQASASLHELIGKTTDKGPEKPSGNVLGTKTENKPTVSLLGLKPKDPKLTGDLFHLRQPDSMFTAQQGQSKLAGVLFDGQKSPASEQKPSSDLFDRISTPVQKLTTPGNLSSPRNEPLKVASLVAQPPATASPPLPAKTPEPPVVEEVFDFDAEYSDHEDDKVRKQLVEGETKPSETLPEVKRLPEIEVPEDFNEIFDSIYQSGNMMVNKFGQMTRALQSYILAQNKPIKGMAHEGPEDMKDVDNWRVCEMGLVGKTVEDLLQDVKKINHEKPDLEQKEQAATKGFIKLDTKESEIKRLFAVQNDPSAAARARARLLAPEQQIQQRQLRKTFTRVEKSLKDTEYKATMFKARIAARNRHRSQAKFVPPTVEAVRTTVLKLTDMAERKSRDVEHLEERVRRLRIRSGSATPSRSFGTPEREMRGRWGAAQTPVLALVEEADVEEARSENLRRREVGKKLKGALQRRGGRITDGGP